jgi:hypothetical protein
LAHDHSRPVKRRRGRPHLGVIVDLQTRTGSHDDLIGEIRAEAEHVGRLSQETLRRLASDCEISRIITDGPGQIIDVGRTTRTIPDQLWKALVARDKHCTEPDCDRPPGWCDAHHIRHWTDAGPTNLNNLKLGCRAHHPKWHREDARKRIRKRE